MALPPVAVATVQGTLMCIASCLTAQVIAAYKANVPLDIDWVPVVQFSFQYFLTTPLNFKWQEFLEETWPGFHASPTKQAIESASSDNEKELDEEARDGTLVEPKLNVANTITKAVLDQTVGAATNAWLFALVISFLRAAMIRPEHLAGPRHSASLVLSKAGYDFDAVSYHAVMAAARSGFWPVLVTSWQFWPVASIISFACIKTVVGRTLFNAAAGFVWGIYVSLKL